MRGRGIGVTIYHIICRDRTIRDAHWWHRQTCYSREQVQAVLDQDAAHPHNQRYEAKVLKFEAAVMDVGEV